ncbi:Copper-transporting ATPase HMA5, partial [Lachnellula arida]
MANMATTSFLLSNLHCPSCVSHIKDTLSHLDPQPSSVSPSLVTSWVTVDHEISLPIRNIQNALEESGFEISDVATNTKQPTTFATRKAHKAGSSNIGYLDRLISRLGFDNEPAKAKVANRHLENCEACRLERDVKAAEPSAAESERTSDTAKHEDNIPLVVVDSNNASKTTWRASIAIGGMTCAACSGAITSELKEKDWIQNAVVNLISNSATVDFLGEEHQSDIVESIEDIGYEATIDTVVDIKKLQDDSSKTIRTVEILVDGMFCGHCPEKVLVSLHTFGDRVKVEKPIDIRDPILKISYTPHVPDLTTRSIIAAISEANESLIPSIYHPPTLEERSHQNHRREQLRILYRVLLTLIIAIPTLIIGIIYMSLVPSSNPGRKFLEKPLHAEVSRSQWALFVMATPVYFLCADVFHIRALKEIRSMWRPGSKTPFLQRFYRFGSMNMLMSLGTSIAYISSVAQLIAAGISPPLVPDNSTFYFDSVVFLTLFLLIGRLIESYSKSKTGDAVTMLGKLRPTEALLVVSAKSESNSSDTLIEEKLPNGGNKESVQSINVDLLEFDDVVRVLQGGSPPCDGIVVQGETRFDESSLTGESKLVKKAVGDEVFSGTVNKDGPISVKITGVAGSSMLDQIVKAVREGQTRRAPIERIADTLTGYFVPMVTLIAIVTWIIWLALGVSGDLPNDYLGDSSRGWTTWSLQFAIAVFVVACPCGLALAAPTALFVGGGLAAQNGILVKGGGEAFEKASRLDCIVFDKTGTLTMGGEPIVTDFEVFPINFEFGSQDGQEVILGSIKAIEENSSHTIAKALVSFCKSREIRETEIADIEEIAGKGMRGRMSHHGSDILDEVLIGNEALFTDFEIPLTPETLSTLEAWKLEGKSVALAAMEREPGGWQLAAIFAISDPIRKEARSIIKAIRDRGTDVWMLSGDNQITANAVGAKVGIASENIIAGVLPSQKADKIQYLQKSLKAHTTFPGTEHSTKRAMIAMVGDGINDSPALTTADVGIAIGSGSDIAISSAEFVLVSSNLSTLITLLDLSKCVFQRIKLNFAWALVYNLIALPVAAGVLYPV